jgi:hypothetical protein
LSISKVFTARGHWLPVLSTLENGQIKRNLSTEPHFMSDNLGAVRNRDTLLEDFAAELTSAAYPLALRQGIRGSWIEVELGLWKALAETFRKRAGDWPPTGSPGEFKTWLRVLLADLTESAFCVAVKHGSKGSFRELELGMYRAFRLVIRRRSGAR